MRSVWSRNVEEMFSLFETRAELDVFLLRRSSETREYHSLCTTESVRAEEKGSQVWYLHKRVCGERSNPFLWPKLTESEVDKFVQVSEMPTRKFGCWLGKWAMNRFRTVEGGKLAFKVRRILPSPTCLR